MRQTEPMPERRATIEDARATKDPWSGHPVLLPALEMAVPLWIARLRDHEEGAVRDSIIARWRTEASQPILERGDVMLYGGGKRGEAARAFNALARGLAAMATFPGGVGFAGLHWCVGSRHNGIRSLTPCEEECVREDAARHVGGQ